MPAPHNPTRYGEIWPDKQVQVLHDEIVRLGLGGNPDTVLSGGWAWHFMSPDGHVEYKHLHDHKDIDVIVRRVCATEVIIRLRTEGYVREKTRHDGKTDTPFYRFTKDVDGVHVIIDLFVKDTSPIFTRAMYVMNPDALLGLYDEGIHASNMCIAVQAARKLRANGIWPSGHESLVQLPSPE
jgi:hypothetical protein